MKPMPMPAVAMKDLHDGPLPAPERAAEPLPSPSDWSFELIEQYHDVIRRTPTSWRSSPPSR
jgi:stage V sporulation protein R